MGSAAAMEVEDLAAEVTVEVDSVVEVEAEAEATSAAEDVEQ